MRQQRPGAVNLRANNASGLSNPTQPSGIGMGQHSKVKSGIGRGIGSGSIGGGIANATQNGFMNQQNNNHIAQTQSSQNLNMYNN